MSRALTLAGAATGLAATWCGPGAAAHWCPLAQMLGVPLRIRGAPGVALTFDDGPHPQGTPAVLEVLSRENASATFFLVGEQVKRYPSLVAELIAAGHEPAVHGYRHRSQMRLPPSTFVTDLDRAIAVIADACGRMPACYRPPYGVFTLAGLRAVRRAGLRPLLWSKWGRDWRGDSSAREIALRATSGIGAGDVVLLHDADWYSSARSHWRTATALPAILAECRRHQLEAITVTERRPSASTRP